MAWLEIAKDIAVCLAATIGAVAAILGLNTWKRQNKGQLNQDLSRRILVGLFKYRDSVYGVRYPAMWSHEMPIPPDDESKSMNPDQIRFYGVAKAYQGRWDKVSAQRASLYADLIEAEAIWGERLRELFKVLFSLEHELFMSIKIYLETTNPDTPELRRSALTEIIRSHRDIMYDGLSDNGDDYKNDFTNGVREIEKYLKPKFIF